MGVANSWNAANENQFAQLATMFQTNELRLNQLLKTTDLIDLGLKEKKSYQIDVDSKFEPNIGHQCCKIASQYSLI